jgi:hypothetical protein
LGVCSACSKIGDRPGQPLPEEILKKASAEVTQAGEPIHQIRRLLVTLSKV